MEKKGQQVQVTARLAILLGGSDGDGFADRQAWV
jgi:hypothetical protein